MSGNCNGTSVVQSEHTQVSGALRSSEVWGGLVADLLKQGCPATFRVRGISMLPTIQDGDSVTLEPLGDVPARAGDIIAFMRGPCVCLHRVIAVVHDSASGRITDYLTAGDGLLVDDGRQRADAVIGKVARVRTPGGDWTPNSPLRRLQSAVRAFLGLHPKVRSGLRGAKTIARRSQSDSRATEGAGMDR